MRSTYRVALIMPKGHEYAARLIEGVIGYVQDYPELEVVEVPYDEGRAPAAVYQLDVEGGLVWAHHDASWVLDLRERGAKLVSFNSEWLAEGLPCVGFDRDAILDAAIEHLAMLRRPHAAYVGHRLAENPSKLSLRDGFLERARRRRWTALALDTPGIPSEERHRLAMPAQERELIDFLRALPVPACIHCDDDYVGVLVCRVAEHLGLKVPEDIAVLGFFDLAIARSAKPSLSSIPAPGQLVGAAGMELLHSLLKGEKPLKTHRTVAPPPVARRESTGEIPIRDDDIRQARLLIEQLACQGLTVEQILDHLAISQKTLNKRFAAVYGHTPGIAIRRVQLDRAKQWLVTTNLSIARIAAICGFSEPSNFNVFFKRETGSTPTQYRAQAR